MRVRAALQNRQTTELRGQSVSKSICVESSACTATEEGTKQLHGMHCDIVIYTRTHRTQDTAIPIADTVLCVQTPVVPLLYLSCTHKTWWPRSGAVACAMLRACAFGVCLGLLSPWSATSLATSPHSGQLSSGAKSHVQVGSTTAHATAVPLPVSTAVPVRCRGASARAPGNSQHT